MDYNIYSPCTLSCEVLIIGSGVGGTLLAHELTIAGMDVLMIEEGPFIKHISKRPHYENFSSVWRNGGLTIALGKPSITYAEGCCVGGGREINSGIFQRISESLLTKWSKQYIIEHLSLQSYYDVVETMVKAAPLDYKLDSLILERAAKKLNWAHSSVKIAQKNTLLETALTHGLRLIAQCKAHKLLIKNYRVTEVHAKANGHRVIIRPQHVFVCAGAIHSPSLLLKSGIKKNIGQTLQLHPTVKTLCEFEEPISQNPSPVPSCAITEFMPDIRIGGSVMTRSFIAMAIAEDWTNRRALLDHMDHCGIYYAMIRPQAKGQIRQIPGLKDPLVSFKLTPKDHQQIATASHYLHKAMLAAGAKQIFLNPQNSLMTIHLFSSCPMGENPTLCAVDSYGKVHDYHNLYVNDASIIPEAPGTNPQSTICALALRNAEHFRSTL